MRRPMILISLICACISSGTQADSATPFIESALAHSGGNPELQLRELILAHPERADLQFRLGTLLSRQGLWPEARLAYAGADRLAPGQADILYNLAVCLDHLEQTNEARDFYQAALRQAEQQQHHFIPALVRKRLEELAVQP